MSDAREDWKAALAPSPDCLPLSSLGDRLSEEARVHVTSCVRCQTELALFAELQGGPGSHEERAAGEWVATELQRRASRSRVAPFRSRPARTWYAVAAALVLLVGIGSWMQMREPALDPVTSEPVLYRGARLEVLAPVGDLPLPPNELRWRAVPNASRYDVRIVEVDGTIVWSGSTSDSRIALPPDVVARFAPAKRLQWQVKAVRGSETLAASETQSVRVSVENPRKTP